MKILLIQPKHLKWPDRIFEPLGLGYIASFLRENGYREVEIATAVFESDRNIIAKALKADLVGISALSPMMTHAKILLEAIKRRNPKVKIILGGVYPLALPEAVLRDKNVDFVIRGEGEVTFYKLVKAIEAGKDLEEIAGISYRRDGEIVHNPDAALISDLDSLPFPERGLFNQEKFIRRYHQYLGERRLSLLSSRGCTFSCKCCASKVSWGKCWRGRTPQNIIQEVEELVSKYDIEYIDFMDALFTLDKHRVYQLTDLLLRKKFKINWGCYVHPVTVDEDMLRKMKKAGCRDIYLGVENGSVSILKALNKNLSLEKIREVFKICRKISLHTFSFFLIGLPEESKETIEATEDLIVQIRPNYVSFFILVPFPGCGYYEYAKQRGYVNDNTDWTQIDSTRATMPTKHFSREEINKEVKRLLKKYSHLSGRRRFSISLLLRKAIMELRNRPISEFSFLISYKLWRYLKQSLFTYMLEEDRN